MFFVFRVQKPGAVGMLGFFSFSLVMRRTAGQAKRCTDGKDEKKKLKLTLKKTSSRRKGRENTW
jgi:hypothetical protein